MVVHVDPSCRVTIGDNVSVGHCALIHGCVIEDGECVSRQHLYVFVCLGQVLIQKYTYSDVIVGMNSVVLDNAVIGRGSIIGAGCVVKKGMVVPPYSLVVGVPGAYSLTLRRVHLSNSLSR